MNSLILLLVFILVVTVGYKLIFRMLALRGHEVTTEELMNLSRQGEWILDVRTDEEYKEGHIPEAHHLPLRQLAMRQDEIPKNVPVYVICHTGKRSAEGVLWLLKHGWSQVYTVLGGIEKWKGPMARE